MEKKEFILTKAEIKLQKRKSTKSLGITGPTWEEAMRFQMEDGTRTLQGEKEDGIITKYVVYWPDNPDLVFKNVPAEVTHAFKSHKFSQEFIDLAIKSFRKSIRSQY